MPQHVHGGGDALDGRYEEAVAEGEEVVIQGLDFGAVVEGPGWGGGVAVGGGHEEFACQAVDFGSDANEVLMRVDDYGYDVVSCWALQ